MWNGSEMIMQIGAFGLPGVQIEYYKRGFQRPIDGDQAKIDVHVSLPCAPGSDELADDYVWGDDIVLFGKPLNPDWGSSIAKGKRTVIFTAMGSTFAEAFEGAENDVAVMLMPLADAMDARKERMRAADWRP
jgi:hypothetical protein